jgi:glutathione synthase/RimK-type ligase-like ATP-grasp enzyme
VLGLPVPAGSGETLARILQTHGLNEAVVKPVVSMCGLDTWRTSRGLAHGHEPEWSRLSETRDMLVQEYLAEIALGELSFIFFDRAFGHALRKTPRAGEFRVQEEYGGTRAPFEPDANLLAQARRALDGVDGPLTWARVDGVEVDGKFVLMELEVIDPTLFFAYDDGSPERFADAVERAITAQRSLAGAHLTRR